MENNLAKTEVGLARLRKVIVKTEYFPINVSFSFFLCFSFSFFFFKHQMARTKGKELKKAVRAKRQRLQYERSNLEKATCFGIQRRLIAVHKRPGSGIHCP